MTDDLVSDAQEKLLSVSEASGGNNGYISFELDPLIEDLQINMPHAQRVKRYIELAKHWGKAYVNRMIKVPATAAGLDALEEVAASGVTINVTLVFSERQYLKARESIWRGAQRRKDGLN